MANRPAPSAALTGYFFCALDVGVFYQCNGTAWIAVGVAPLQVTTQIVNYTIPSTQTLTIMAASGKTVTLPTAVGVAGQSCIIKNNGSATSTVVTTILSQTIEGALTYNLTNAFASIRAVSDGANWLAV